MSESIQQQRLRVVCAESGSAHRIRRGELLHHAGDPLRHVHLVLEGWVGRTRASVAGDVAFTGVHIAGDIVGVDALLSGELPDDLTALTNGSVLRAPVQAVRASVMRDVDLALEITGLLTADSRFLREALLSVGRQSSSERLSTFILQTRQRLVAAGLIAEDARCFDLPLTQVQLAAVTGLTAVHVNRVLRLLREAGWLDIRSGVVRINDMAALRREARSGTLAQATRVA